METMEVTNNIYWVGALDPNLRVFDIIMNTQYGTTYNSYLVKGSEKTALFETVKDTFYDEWINNLKEHIDLKQLDYIILNHTEPDHAGSLEYLLNECVNATVVGSKAAITFLKSITNKDFKALVAKEGDTIDLGNKTIRFIMAPFLHWPDSMYSYIEEDNTLITCDSFGCHYCNEKIFNDKIDEEFIDAYKYYFDVILGPFKKHVLSALNKIKDLKLANICPGHGPVLRKDINKYLNLYKEWSIVEKREKPSVVIVYVSAYGYTKMIAEKIAEGINSLNTIDVLLYDLSETDESTVLNQINQASGLLIGSPTILSDALPPINELLTKLNPIIHKGLITGAFGSYGWTGEAVPNIENRLKQLRFKIPVKGLRINFKPSKEESQESYSFGVKFGNQIK